MTDVAGAVAAAAAAATAATAPQSSATTAAPTNGGGAAAFAAPLHTDYTLTGARPVLDSSLVLYDSMQRKGKSFIVTPGATVEVAKASHLPADSHVVVAVLDALYESGGRLSVLIERGASPPNSSTSPKSLGLPAHRCRRRPLTCPPLSSRISKR
jgi:hypothetical protein